MPLSPACRLFAYAISSAGSAAGRGSQMPPMFSIAAADADACRHAFTLIATPLRRTPWYCRLFASLIFTPRQRIQVEISHAEIARAETINDRPPRNEYHDFIRKEEGRMREILYHTDAFRHNSRLSQDCTLMRFSLIIRNKWIMNRW